jgi:hypothetical protein
MTRHSLRFLAVVICSAIITAAAQQPLIPPDVRAAAERITTKQLKSDLEFLASDELKGRNTPSPGFDAAAAYIEARLRTAGVKPLGDDGSYRQPYVMRETTLDVGRASVRIGEHAFAPGADFALQAFAGELSTRTPVSAVYVGHGWVAAGVDPYRDIDVKGKVVVVHAQSARPKGAKVRQLGRVTIGGTPPIVEARRRGAIAVMYLSSADTQLEGRPGQVVRRELDPPVPSAYAAPLVTAIRLRAGATRVLLEGTALDPESLDERTKNQDYPASFALPAKVSIAVMLGA